MTARTAAYWTTTTRTALVFLNRGAAWGGVLARRDGPSGAGDA